MVDLDATHDWYMGVAPVLRAIAVALRAVLPQSLAAAGLNLDEKHEKEIGEQLELAEEATGLVSEAVVAATGRRPADPSELALC